MRTNENTAETLTATLARPVAFPLTDASGYVYAAARRPAGTTVYARQRRDGLFAVRVPGTLLCQDVPLSALIPA